MQANTVIGDAGVMIGGPSFVMRDPGARSCEVRDRLADVQVRADQMIPYLVETL